MFVYTVVKTYPYEGDALIDIFATRELAVEYCEQQKDYKKNPKDDTDTWYYSGNMDYDFYSVDKVEVKEVL